LRLGDRVMQCKNDYDRNVFNGDVGKVHEIQRFASEYDGECVHVMFEEADSFHHDSEQQLVEYSMADAQTLSLAYACTVHKSQGSEYQAVILPLFMNHYVMLRRNLLYTGLTRAKKLVILIGQEAAVIQAVKACSSDFRYTSLQMLLRGVPPFTMNHNKTKEFDCNKRRHRKLNLTSSDELHKLWDIYDLEQNCVK